MGADVVGTDSRVTLHFSLQLEDGSIVDSNFEGKPASFEMGDGSLLSGYENVLLGLHVGAKESFIVKAIDGFGEHNAENIQQFPVSQFADELSLEPGLMVSFADAAKNELAGVVCGIEGDQVYVDFNHPLAGRDIGFNVHILKVETVDKKPLDQEVPWTVLRGLDNAD